MPGKEGLLAQDLPSSTANLEKTISDAIWSPLDSTGLEVSGRMDASAIIANASRLTFAIEPSQLKFVGDHDAYRDSVDVLCVQRSKQGKALTSSRHKVDFTLTEEQLKQMKTKIYTGGYDINCVQKHSR